MRPARNPIQAWNAFWFGPISARPLGAFRIIFGLITLFMLALNWVDLDYWWTSAGLLRGGEPAEVAGPLRFSLLFGHDDPATVHLVHAFTCLLAVLFTVGWHTRPVGFALYFAALTLHHRNILANGGPDVLLIVLLFPLMFSHCGAAYSLDARRRARKLDGPAEPLIQPWAQRLIQIQLAAIYLNTAVLKCNGKNWLDGTALHWVLNNPEIGRFSLDPLAQYPLAINLLTYAALGIELMLPFLVWFRSSRRWVLPLGVMLHVGVFPIVNVPVFGELMMACYLTFLTPEELDGLLRLVDVRRWFRSRNELSRLDFRRLRVDQQEPPRGPRQLALPIRDHEGSLFEGAGSSAASD